MKRVVILLIYAFTLCLSLNISNAETFVCKQETYDLLKQLSDSRLAGGDIFLFTTTHQDIGWIDHPEACIAMRDSLWLTPYIERLGSDPDFKMDIEQASIVMEYIHRHPDKKSVIDSYIQDGRICIGGTYMQPYEEMYSGESLARQFYLGKKWLRDNFSGYDAQSYFNVDVPGRTLQMPQIMSKAGVNNLVISRQERGLYFWESPDGSKVRTYSPGHYIFFYGVLGKENEAAVKAFAEEAVLWYEKYNTETGAVKAVMPAMLNYEFIWDQKPVQNCEPFMKMWNSITDIESESGQKAKVSLPEFKYAIADEFYARLDKTSPEIPTIKGERPDVWLYIHGPSHERAVTASREGDILMTAAEKFSTIDALIDGSFSGYPKERLGEAWKAKIYPDHGWGGKNGVITDNIFQSKFETARSEAGAILDTSLKSIASKIDTGSENGIPIVVFNSLSWTRSDPVEIDMKFDPGYAKIFQITDDKGRGVLSQPSEVEWHEDGSYKSAHISFIAEDVPSIGYKTFYLAPTQELQPKGNVGDTSRIENEFYRIDLAKGGIRQIFDKKLKRNLLDSSKFLGGEVFTMKSEGNGAGEFDAVQLPIMDGFDTVGNHSPRWELCCSGTVFSSIKYRSDIRNAVVEQTLKVYHQIPKIVMDISILNWEGILYREYRMALPIDITGGQVSYEVPFGVLNVGRDEMKGPAGERYLALNETLHPRGIENWIGVSGEDFGVTLSSSVATADYIDPTDNPSLNTILQPILFASRKSCHWEGNEYLQHGDHHFSFSMTSHKPGWENGHRFGRQANEKLQCVINPKKYAGASLETAKSFFSVNNKNVIVTALKKAEDDDSVIVRMYNLSDKGAIVQIDSFIDAKNIVKTSLIEEETGNVTSNRNELGKYSIETYKMRF